MQQAVKPIFEISGSSSGQIPAPTLTPRPTPTPTPRPHRPPRFPKSSYSSSSFYYYSSSSSYSLYRVAGAEKKLRLRAAPATLEKINPKLPAPEKCEHLIKNKKYFWRKCQHALVVPVVYWFKIVGLFLSYSNFVQLIQIWILIKIDLRFFTNWVPGTGTDTAGWYWYSFLQSSFFISKKLN